MDKYEVSKQIGKGGQGLVFLVMENKSKQTFAMKVVPKTSSSIAEAEIQKQLQNIYHLDHPYEISHANIVPLIDSFQDEKSIYMVMELCQHDLYNYVQKHKTISEKEILDIFRQIVSGVKFLHDNGVAHRDIKLENVIFCNDKWKLTDFGHATKKQISHNFVGTLDYLPPEIINAKLNLGEYETFPADMWELGITLYDMTFLRPPFLEKTTPKTFEAILTNEVPFKGREISPFLTEIITRLLEKNSKKRIDIDSLLLLLFPPLSLKN